jgi:hypothetical protein
VTADRRAKLKLDDGHAAIAVLTFFFVPRTRAWKSLIPRRYERHNGKLYAWTLRLALCSLLLLTSANLLDDEWRKHRRESKGVALNRRLRDAVTVRPKAKLRFNLARLSNRSSSTMQLFFGPFRIDHRYNVGTHAMSWVSPD